jgi:hypothetical protein
MQKCHKCAKTYDDEAKICRVCGSILDVCSASSGFPAPTKEPEIQELSWDDVVPAIMQEPSPGTSENMTKNASWTCAKCGKKVPDTFDVCWNCFTAKDGQIDQQFAEIAQADREFNADTVEEMGTIRSDDIEEIELAQPVERTNPEPTKPTHHEHLYGTCLRCGSTDIARHLRVVDQGHHSDGYLELVAYGDPDAIFFKDPTYGKIYADVCGQCGHVELRIQNPGEIFDQYRRSKT